MTTISSNRKTHRAQMRFLKKIKARGAKVLIHTSALLVTEEL